MRGLLLLRHRSFSVLWFAGLVSLTGDWLLGVALPIYVFKLTRSPAATSAVVAVAVTGALLAGAVAGVYVDRWDRRRVLIIANLLQVAVILPLLAVTSPGRLWIVLAVAFVESALGQFVAPAEHALLPRLVGEAELAAANSLNTLNRNLARLVGPALGAIVATTLGLSGAAVLDAASFAVAAGLVATIGGSHRAVPAAAAQVEHASLLLVGASGAEPAGPASGTADVAATSAPRVRRLPRADRVSALSRWREELVEGVRAIRGSRRLRALMSLFALTAIGEGIMGSLFAVFAGRGLTAGASAIGWLMSAQAVGGIIGGIAATILATRLHPVPTVLFGFGLFGVVDVVIFNLPRLTPGLAPQLVLFALVGIVGTVASAGAMTLLQTEVGDALRGRVFAAFSVTQAAASLIGAGLAATLTERFGVFTVLTAQGTGYVVAAVLFGTLVSARPPCRRRRAVRLPAGGSASQASAALSRDSFARRWNS